MLRLRSQHSILSKILTCMEIVTTNSQAVMESQILEMVLVAILSMK